MKLFGNTGSRGVPRTKPERRPAAEPRAAATATAVLDRPADDGGRFRRGYWTYVIVMLVIIAAGLVYLWLRMDTYERSLPTRAVETWMAGHSAGDWRQTLTEQGFQSSFVDGLDLAAPDYYKNLSVYTDETPAYSVSFSARPLLTVKLTAGEKLRFGKHGWTVGEVTASDGGLAVYVPEGATVTVDGVALGPECLEQRDAQKLSLGVFEAGRTDIPGLSKYVLNRRFTLEGVEVTAADGTVLTPSTSAGNAYYYPPLTSDYRIVAPADAAVTVNGVRLTAENAGMETLPPGGGEFEMFEGVEDRLPFVFASLGRTAWTVEGLVAAPEVTATSPAGAALTGTCSGNVWDFPSEPAGKPDAALAAEQKDLIMACFDAHVAYLGNRNGTMENNYARFIAYLLPDGEAMDQAVRARGSIIWAKGLKTHPDASLGEVLRYGADCFTAQVDFTPEGEPDGVLHSNIYIFVRSDGAWKVLRIVSK